MRIRIEGQAGTAAMMEAVGVSNQSAPWHGVGILALSDLAVIGLSFSFSILVWAALRANVPIEMYYAHWPVPICVLGVYWMNGLYRQVGLSPVDELRKCAVSTTVAFLGIIAVSFLVKESALYSRGILCLGWALTMIGQPTARQKLKRLLASRELFGRSTLMVGSSALAERLTASLNRQPELGLHIKGFCPMEVVDDQESDWDGRGLTAVAAEAQKCGASACVLAANGWDSARISQLVTGLTKIFERVILVPGISGIPSLWVSTTDLNGLVGIEVKDNLLRPSAQVLKRATDLLFCAVFMLPIAAVWLLAALAVRLTSAGPVLYSQVRIGKDGREFRIYKFRTMVVNAQEVLKEHLRGNELAAEEWQRCQKLRKDPRLTRIGAFLRRSSVDEIPQFWNVVRGEMSLVGPRPIVEGEVEKYGTSFGMYKRVTPGLSGLWQISGRSNTTYDERVNLDAYYVRNWSLWLDLHVIARTVAIVLGREGAY